MRANQDSIAKYFQGKPATPVTISAIKLSIVRFLSNAKPKTLHAWYPKSTPFSYMTNLICSHGGFCRGQLKSSCKTYVYQPRYVIQLAFSSIARAPFKWIKLGVNSPFTSCSFLHRRSGASVGSTAYLHKWPFNHVVEGTNHTVIRSSSGPCE